MFANLGLFARYRCPQQDCGRSKCMFAHVDQRPSKSIDPVPPSKKPPTTQLAPPPATSSTQPTRRASVMTSSFSTVSPSSTASAVHSKPTVKANVNLNEAPRIQLGKTTNQPVSDRQKALRTLFTQFQKLYAGVLEQQPTLAHESSLAQENDISGTTNNLKAYKSAIHHAAVSISRRPPPDRIPHSSIGTVRESRAAQQAEQLAKASRLSPERLRRYCLSHETMVQWGYPDSTITELVVPSTTCVSSEGFAQTCYRCKIDFVVSTSQDMGDCIFHHGRTVPERIEGKRVWIYSCCRKERGAAGCEEGVHVFTDNDDDVKLAQRVPYKTTAQIIEEKGLKGTKHVDVVGIDCEMISTTAGSSLARISIIDENGAILLDEFVRQTVSVLDYNTRFSGVRAADLENAVMDINDVRAAACSFIGPDTVIVGHGLENDLRAMRLLHPHVIDTAILFPHDKGAPFRRALRDLVKEKLGYFIQVHTADAGHSSVEDAKATLDLLKWQVRDDQDDIQA